MYQRFCKSRDRVRNNVEPRSIHFLARGCLGTQLPAETSVSFMHVPAGVGSLPTGREDLILDHSIDGVVLASRML